MKITDSFPLFLYVYSNLSAGFFKGRAYFRGEIYEAVH